MLIAFHCAALNGSNDFCFVVEDTTANLVGCQKPTIGVIDDRLD